MAGEVIQFDDGAAYERYMGVWSRLAGDVFLDWLAPARGLKWLDVGCGNGAFTVMLVERCAPARVDGIDPSEAQINFAKSRSELRGGEFRVGDAMKLPYPDDSFDAAVMPLVIFFVPEPRVGVAEMARVVRPGGVVAAYAWDVLAGGFPYDLLWNEIRAAGFEVPVTPSQDASRVDEMRRLWTEAGLHSVETREIVVQRTFESFEEYWQTVLGGPSVSKQLASMPPEVLERVKSNVRQKLPAPDAAGRITCTARANAVKGVVTDISPSPERGSG